MCFLINLLIFLVCFFGGIFLTVFLFWLIMVKPLDNGMTEEDYKKRLSLHKDYMTASDGKCVICRYKKCDKSCPNYEDR